MQFNILRAAIRYRIRSLLPFLRKESDSHYLYWSTFIGGIADKVVSGQSEEDAIRSAIKRLSGDEGEERVLLQEFEAIDRKSLRGEGDLCAEMAFRILLHVTKGWKGLHWKMWDKESRAKLKEMKRDYWHKKWCTLSFQAKAKPD